MYDSLSTHLMRKAVVPLPAAKMNFSFEQIELKVKSEEKARSFYQDLLGFQDLGSGEPAAAAPPGSQVLALGPAGNSNANLLLHVNDRFQPPDATATGLYHVAFLLPSRAALAQLARRLLDSGYPLQGASDHYVSEAIYLADPDGNGIELYADRPREHWRAMGDGVTMTTQPLDWRNLLQAADSQRTSWQMPAGTTIGHLHLTVSHLEKAERFYHQGLGLAVTVRNYPGVLFMAADGYHHHVGANIWRWGARNPAPAHTTGLAAYTAAMNPAALKRAVQRLAQLGYEVTPMDNGYLTHDGDENKVLIQETKG